MRSASVNLPGIRRDTQKRSYIAAAKECCSGCAPDDVESIELPAIICSMQEQERLCESILSNIVTLAKTSPNYEPIASIPDIGENLASRIIAELGDIRRFRNRSVLVAYTGLNPKILQSGEVDGTHLKISKRGNKHLRCQLFWQHRAIID